MLRERYSHKRVKETEHINPPPGSKRATLHKIEGLKEALVVNMRTQDVSVLLDTGALSIETYVCRESRKNGFRQRALFIGQT